MNYGKVNKAKKRAALAILILGAAGAFSIFISTQLKAAPNFLEEKIKEEIEAALQKKSSYVEDASAKNKNLTQIFLEKNINKDISLNLESITSIEDVYDFTKARASITDILRENISSFLPTLPSESQVRTIRSDSREISTKYLSQFAAALEEVKYKFKDKLSDNEEVAIVQVLEKNDFGLIDNYKAYFNAASDAIFKLTVPEPFMEFHKKELFIFKALSLSLVNIKTVEEDPLRALIAIEIRKSLQKELLSNIESLNAFK